MRQVAIWAPVRFSANRYPSKSILSIWPYRHLLVFDAAPSCPLSSLDALLISLDITALHRSHQSATALPWPSQVTRRALS